MEDAHTHLLSLSEDKDAAFFAVYDGHGGAKVAQYAGSHVHRKIVSQPSYRKGDVVDAIKKGFLEVDSDMLKDEAMKDELAGTTAVVVLLKGGRIYCGNVGDSRAIASVGGHVQQLSFDHKPSNESETRRIIAAGGWVEFNRVNGNLALSRALGDFVFKKNEKKSPEEQIVTAYPDVIVKNLTPDHEFVLLACDGIWDVLSNEEVVEFVRARIAAKMEPEQICEELMTRCLAPDCQMGGLGCDNMTVVLVVAPASPELLQMDAHRQGDTAEDDKQPPPQEPPPMTTPDEEPTTMPPSPPPAPSSSAAALRESGGEMAVGGTVRRASSGLAAAHAAHRLWPCCLVAGHEEEKRVSWRRRLLGCLQERK
ncbi:hypothetical protein HPB48_014793 [Haemaphysalis longicornis]|uniref:protein-serine/threonine phosphatase n=1 Tax=Haemaphysalis longicornis TaxID=44386 RepID=A0A9J6GDW8_HAELO|nr:hypothetical protein HPB48_014793 [Haemaphysalis longicornis]